MTKKKQLLGRLSIIRYMPKCHPTSRSSNLHFHNQTSFWSGARSRHFNCLQHDTKIRIRGPSKTGLLALRSSWFNNKQHTQKKLMPQD
uniref:Uncharacterized protein n=1 Tax=Arundo donax TaxID=35708 RepID=A0A0A8XSE1_ARUDO